MTTAGRIMREEQRLKLERMEAAVRALLARLAEPPAGPWRPEDVDAVLAILEGREQ